MPAKPLVALVGRPNVGKSTLFNRLVGGRIAIVENLPGTTRDRHYGDVEWNGRVFTLIDTGGLVLAAPDEMTSQVRGQAHTAIAEADVIVLLTDIVDGLTGPDHEIADMLRRTSKPIILVINKTDNLKREMNIHEFYSLGLGEPLPISAEKGMSTGELLDLVIEALPQAPEEDDLEDDALHIAIVGRTNVGKSSLINRFMGYERVIVSSTPNTTRDAIDTRIRYQEREVVLIDTAGIRKRGTIERGIEQYSVIRSLRAISRADVVVLLIDGVDGVTAQDAHIAGFILEENKSVMVVINKWDLVEKDTHTMHIYEERVRQQLKFMPYVPVLFVSALTGQRTRQILATALEIEQEGKVRLSTSEINALIRDATSRRTTPTKYGRRLKFYYGTQANTSPPTFVFFVNDPQLMHFGYERFLENQIRRRYKFAGTPLKLVFRGHGKGKD